MKLEMLKEKSLTVTMTRHRLKKALLPVYAPLLLANVDSELYDYVKQMRESKPQLPAKRIGGHLMYARL